MSRGPGQPISYGIDTGDVLVGRSYAARSRQWAVVSVVQCESDWRI